MTIRIEFGKSRSPVYQQAVNVARKAKTYQIATENAVVTHSVELDPIQDRELMHQIWRLVSGWKTTNFYIDGALADWWPMQRVLFPDAPVGQVEISPGVWVDADKVVDTHEIKGMPQK